MRDVGGAASGAEAPGEADLVALRRQVGAAVRAARRPRFWIGAAREVAHIGLNALSYPLGVGQAQQTPTAPLRAQTLAARALLAHDPELAGTPVVLVHGYLHNRSAFRTVSRQLRRAGFSWVHGLNYNPVHETIPQLAERLGVEVERVLQAAGAEKCMIVGHSMGGVIARYYVTVLGGEETVDTVIMLGTPHRGTYASYVGIGRANAQMRPGSALLRELETAARPSGVRWVSFWSDLDAAVIPAVSAKLVHPAFAAHNIRVRDTGHLSLLLSGEVMRGIIAVLGDRNLYRSPPLSGPAGDADDGTERTASSEG